MNPPSWLERRFAARGGATFFGVLAAVAVVSWLAGAVPWWLAVFMVLIVGPVRKAGQKVRAYDAWFREWQGMGGQNAPPPRPQKKPKRAGVVAAEAIACGLVALAILAYVPQGQKPSDTLAVLWFLAGVGFVWKLAELAGLLWRSRGRSSARASARGKAKAQDDAVAWVMQRAASSPSRAEAMRQLPEYSARLLGQGQQTGHSV